MYIDRSFTIPLASLSMNVWMPLGFVFVQLARDCNVMSLGLCDLQQSRQLDTSMHMHHLFRGYAKLRGCRISWMIAVPCLKLQGWWGKWSHDRQGWMSPKTAGKVWERTKRKEQCYCILLLLNCDVYFGVMIYECISIYNIAVVLFIQ